MSGYMSYRLGIRFFYSLVYAVGIYEMVVLTDIWINTYGAYNYFRTICSLVLILCLINDAVLFTKISVTEDALDNNYILGGKFPVAYYHLLLLMFFAAMIKERDKGRGKQFNNLIFWVLVVFSAVITIVVDTKTGLVGILFFAALYLICGVVKKLLVNPVVTCIALYAFSATIFFWDYILSFEIVQNIIVTILHRSLSLTGRRGIYRILYEVFKQRPLLGWGYESMIVGETLYGNAQNGVVHLAIQYGIIGVICFTLFVFWTMKRCGDSHASKMVIVCAMYSFFVMGTVEIVFSNLFFIIMAIMAAFATDNKEIAHKRKVEIRI
ncbi:MAG: O-antigen ligase family protein [Clostridium sp.]|nr:O-antigen ligase family protein [Clostridium sp.]